MKKGLWLLIAAAIVVLGLGYTGFLPGLSGLMGTDQMRNLGIDPSAADQQLASGVVPGIKEAQGKASLALSSGQLTVLERRYASKTIPVTADAQVKVNTDGTAEVSGKLIVDQIPDYARRAGISEEMTRNFVAYLPEKKEVPFYAKVGAEAAGGDAGLALQAVELGRIDVPKSALKAANPMMNRLVLQHLRQVTGVDPKTIRIENGQLLLEGSVR
ncbi:MAG: hypothetical protein ACM3QZ_12420 [Solirubrobacterales bacterium]